MLTNDQAISHTQLTDGKNSKTWLATMSRRLEKFIPDQQERKAFISTVLYEARRTGVVPKFVPSVVQTENGFKKYAILD